MILTLKKVQHKGANRIGICFPYANEHNLRHSFATHLIEAGIYIRYMQQLLGQSGIKITMMYTHITSKAINQIQSSLDRLNLKTEDKNDKKNDKNV